MLRKLSISLSYIFHPVFVPIIGVLIFMNSNTYLNFTFRLHEKLAIAATVLIYTVVFPLIITSVLYYKNYIKSIFMSRVEDRKLPFLAVIFFNIWLIYLLDREGVPTVFVQFMRRGTLSVAILFVLAIRKIKWSVHMTGMGSLLGIIIKVADELSANFYEAAIGIILLSGILAWSRLYLEVHKSREVYLGFILGLLMQSF